jgi:hypothetical protein
MTRFDDIDYGELEKMWSVRAERVAAVRERADPTGMTRPERDPSEREWLDERGETSPFVEVPRRRSQHNG